LKEFKGQTVGIDGYCWLHQGVYSCSEDLANGKGIDKLVNYCKKKLDLIVECGV
jgi:exonuclease-1